MIALAPFFRYLKYLVSWMMPSSQCSSTKPSSSGDEEDKNLAGKYFCISPRLAAAFGSLRRLPFYLNQKIMEYDQVVLCYYTYVKQNEKKLFTGDSITFTTTDPLIPNVIKKDENVEQGKSNLINELKVTTECDRYELGGEGWNEDRSDGSEELEDDEDEADEEIDDEFEDAVVPELVRVPLARPRTRRSCAQPVRYV